MGKVRFSPGGATLLMHLNFLLPAGVAAAEETADTNYFQFVICGCGCQEAVGFSGWGPWEIRTRC